jgi:hypothetical protein
MTENLDGVLLTDGRSRIFLHPPMPYPDGHGFHHQADVICGPFQGAIEAISYERPIALQVFHRQLVILYRSLKGEAELPSSYENLKVSLTGDGLGHITVRVDVREHVSAAHNVRLSFTFGIDQTHLPPAISAVERLFLRPER